MFSFPCILLGFLLFVGCRADRRRWVRTVGDPDLHLDFPPGLQLVGQINLLAARIKAIIIARKVRAFLRS